MSKLDEIFNIDSEKSDKLALEETIDSAGLAEMGIEEAEGKIEIAVDAGKAQKLNQFVNKRLAKLYELAQDAAEELVNDIKNGDTDARSIEGTARLIESGVRALTEINKYNMFLQQQIYDSRVREEVEKLHAQLEDQNLKSTREGVIKIIKSEDKNEE